MATLWTFDALWRYRFIRSSVIHLRAISHDHLWKQRRTPFNTSVQMSNIGELWNASLEFNVRSMVYLCVRHAVCNICLKLTVLYRHSSVPTELLSNYNDVIMSTMESQITGVSVVYSTFYLGADQRKHQCSASHAFGRGTGEFPEKGPVNVSIWRRHHDF